MTATTDFFGPLAHDLADYVATIKAAGRASPCILTQLHALDRLTLTIPLPSQSIDEAFAKAWLAPSDTRGPNTRRGRHFLLRGFCLFLANRRPQTFVPHQFLCPRRRPAPPPISTPGKKSRMVKKLEATEEPQLAALHFGVTCIQPGRVKATLHDVTLE